METVRIFVQITFSLYVVITVEHFLVTCFKDKQHTQMQYYVLFHPSLEIPNVPRSLYWWASSLFYLTIIFLVVGYLTHIAEPWNWAHPQATPTENHSTTCWFQASQRLHIHRALVRFEDCQGTYFHGYPPPLPAPIPWLCNWWSNSLFSSLAHVVYSNITMRNMMLIRVMVG